MQDYGGPVGFRMALAHPERVKTLIVQDALLTMRAWSELGDTPRVLGRSWRPMKTNCERTFSPLLSRKHATSETIPMLNSTTLILWTDEYAFLNSPVRRRIQSDLFYDYRTNVDAYPKWPIWMQKTQPPLLVIWVKHDLSFDLGEPERYHKDVPNAQVHVT